MRLATFISQCTGGVDRRLFLGDIEYHLAYVS